MKQVNAALDAIKPKAVPAAPTAAQRQQAAEDALYASFMGKGTPPEQSVPLDENDLFAKVFPA
jgi:hypothetical protein